MLRIAFCDDETEILEELESLTEQYGQGASPDRPEY